MKINLLIFLFHLICLKSFSQPNIRAIVKNASCGGKADGSIDLQVNGNAPFKFKWSNGSNLQNIKKIPSGNYEVEVFDMLGHKSQIKVEVKANNNLSISLSLESNNLNINVSGGDAPYTYTLSNISNLSSISRSEQSQGLFQNLSMGSYAIIVKDSNGCIAAEGIDIN